MQKGKISMRSEIIFKVPEVQNMKEVIYNAVKNYGENIAFVIKHQKEGKNFEYEKHIFILLSKCFLKINLIEVELIYKKAAHIYCIPFGECGHITYTHETTFTVKVVNISPLPKVYSCPNFVCMCV